MSGIKLVFSLLNNKNDVDGDDDDTECVHAGIRYCEREIKNEVSSWGYNPVVFNPQDACRLQVFPRVSPKESQNCSILISRPVLAIDKKSCSLLPYSFRVFKHVLTVRCRYSVYEAVTVAVQCHSLLKRPAPDSHYK